MRELIVPGKCVVPSVSWALWRKRGELDRLMNTRDILVPIGRVLHSGASRGEERFDSEEQVRTVMLTAAGELMLMIEPISVLR